MRSDMSQKGAATQLRDRTIVSVIGAGSMGSGIAIALAATGCVRLFDIDVKALERASETINTAANTLASHPASRVNDPDELTENIIIETELRDAVTSSDFIFEAVAEDFEIKKSVYNEIEALVADDTIIASNTSSLPLNQLCTSLEAPERFVGAHWFHPPHIVPVVEVVQADATADTTIARVMNLLRECGKDPVRLQRPIKGYIGNRVQSAMAREAWALLTEGIAAPEDIDAAIKGTFGFRLPLLGVFEKGDFSGLDIHHKVLTELLPEVNADQEPADALTDLVEAGRYGVKTESGVYGWENIDLKRETSERDVQLLDQLTVYAQRESRWSRNETQ
jgi:3-hydroxybutyryl-CoA dehydrogenase